MRATVPDADPGIALRSPPEPAAGQEGGEGPGQDGPGRETKDRVTRDRAAQQRVVPDREASETGASAPAGSDRPAAGPRASGPRASGPGGSGPGAADPGGRDVPSAGDTGRQHLDWPGLMRVGMRQFGLRPAEFWGLCPAELMLILGLEPGAGPLTRAGLVALLQRFPDHAPAAGNAKDASGMPRARPPCFMTGDAGNG